MKYIALTLVALVLNPSLAYPQSSASRVQLQAQIQDLRAELNAKEAQFLDPDPADVAAYAALVNQPDSGLIRLLPREDFDSPEKLTIRGGGAYYSFTRRTHEYGFASDIALANGELSVGFAGADYGFIARLADARLLAVGLETPGVAVLAARAAPSLEPQARDEQRLAMTGFTVGQTRYAARAPVEVGATYVLRSVYYGASDVLVCFQVLHRDDDGSIVLAWRLLKQYPTPQLTHAHAGTARANGLSN